jgi:glycosyltransferase involved in cell wall biosynthesis
MHVLILKPQIDLGGATFHIETLSRALVERGNQVSIGAASGEYLPQLLRTGAFFVPTPLYPSTLPNLIKSISYLRGYTRKNHVHVIHSHHRFTTIVGRFVSLLTGIPLVVTLHEFKSDRRLLSNLWIGDITIVPSQSLKNHLNLLLMKHNKTIVVIPNAIYPEIPIIEEGYEEPGDIVLPVSDGLTVGYIGRLSPEKGVKSLLEAVPLVKKMFPNVQFLIVGSGPEEQEIKEIAHQAELCATVQFLGTRMDIPQILQRLDVVVIPSLLESFSNVALEAMWAVKPIVATSVGGIPEVVHDGENGYLVPPGSPQNLADRICQLLSDPQLRYKLGKNGYRMANELFPVSRFAHRTIEVYQIASKGKSIVF